MTSLHPSVLVRFFPDFRFNGWFSHFWWLFLDLCVSAVSLGLFLSCVLLVCKISLKIDHTEQQTAACPSRKSIIVCVCGAHFFPQRSDCGYAWGLHDSIIWGWKTQERRSLGRGRIPFACIYVCSCSCLYFSTNTHRHSVHLSTS
jgi:hypothetical protein